MKINYNNKSFLFVCLILFMAFGLWLLFWWPELIKSRLNKWDFTNSDNEGQIGDAFSGTLSPVIAWIAALLTFAAFIVQYIANQQQRKQFDKQAEDSAIERFEGRFFDLLKLHRDNVNEMKAKGYEGKEVCKYIAQQIISCRDEITPFFEWKETHQIYTPNYLTKLRSEKTLADRGISIKEMAKIDVAYCIVFFGLEYDGIYILNKIFEDKYEKKFFQSLINYLSLKPNEESSYWIKWRKLKRSKNTMRKLLIADMIAKKRKVPNYINPTTIDLDSFYYKDNYTKFYCGFQLHLGHYFRHLYQTVNFVNDQKILKYSAKYSYIKTLRAQLTTYEQIVFYFNSISSLGSIWELTPTKRYKEFKSQPLDMEIVNIQLITKYNLIKNMANGQLFRQDFRRFYPNVQFEFQENLSRNALEKMYN